MFFRTCLFLASASFFAQAATPADLTLRGLPNFMKVNDKVFRGAQPSEEGFASLAALGIKTVVDLREVGEHSQADEQRVAEANGMHYVSVPMKGMATPSAESVSAVLKLLESADAGPVFVHCQRGADRTGAVIACYRIEHDGWNSRKALDEASSMGMSWYQRALKNYVARFAPAPSAPPAGMAAAIVATGQLAH
jgi:uncharacterized protein (TIGR01244 family)